MPRTEISDLHVLVVDDEAFIRSLIMRMLDDMGFRHIHQAEDGDKALAALTHGIYPADLIILDLEMPALNGFEFLDVFRHSKEIAHTQAPVVVLTGHSEARNVIQAAELGIHGFLVKPVSRAQFEKQVMRALNSPAIDPNKVHKE